MHESVCSFKPQDGDDGRFLSIPKPLREADRWAVAGSDKIPHDPRTGRNIKYVCIMVHYAEDDKA